MRPPRIILSTLLIGAATLGVVACGGSGGNAHASTAGIVSIAKVDGSNVLASSAGKTLYSAAVEKGGMIRCVGACTSFWAPVLGSSADAKTAALDLHANLGVVTRPDGKQQLAFDGQPLYTFAQEGSHKLQGDGFVDDFKGTHFKWAAARTSGSAVSSGSSESGGSRSGGYGY
jgi:predicted lipoprotein with Yx(FWY)xxD motif